MPRGLLRFRERDRVERFVFRELIRLRRDNRDLSDEEFEKLATEHITEQFEGINPDNLKMILDWLKEMLPILLKLFV